MSSRKRPPSGSQTIDAPHLSASEIRRLPKPRTGFTQFAQEVAAAIKARPGVILVNGFDPDATIAKVDQYVAMSSDVNAKQSAYVSAAEAQLVLGSDIWHSTLVAYQHIQAAARTDGSLQTTVERLGAFLKKKGGRKKAKAPTPPSTTTTPPAVTA